MAASVTVPCCASTFASACAPEASARNVHEPGRPKKRNAPVAEVTTSAVNSPEESSRRT